MLKGALAGAAGTTALNAVTYLDMAVRAPAPLAAMLVGGAAMAASNLPMKQLGVSDPAKWSGEDWAGDAGPHLAYGAVTCAALRRMTPATTTATG